jgi:hypothetical protein
MAARVTAIAKAMEKVRLAYIKGRASVAFYANSYNVGRHAAEACCASENWVAQRTTYRAAQRVPPTPVPDKSEKPRTEPAAPMTAAIAKRPPRRSASSAACIMLRRLRSLLLDATEKFEQRDNDGNLLYPKINADYLKKIEQLSKLIERNLAMSEHETANTKPNGPVQPTGKQRADAASKLRHEIADRLERLREQRRAPQGPVPAPGEAGSGDT